MRIFQSNIQSINTSKHLVNIAIQKHDIDVVLLQEVWHPSGEMVFKDFQKPYTKLRVGRVGGGVAVAVSSKVKMVKRPEYEVDGLEAVWAEVRKEGVQTIVGSVYINVGKIDQLRLLDQVVENIQKDHKRIVICMDANARNSMWDNEAAFLNKNRVSKKMGVRLQEMIEKHNLFVHNTGIQTYHSGHHSSAVDVTLSLGVCIEQKTKWTVIDDELGTPHSGILFDIGSKIEDKKIVIDWDNFDWDTYEEETGVRLKALHEMWNREPSSVQEKEDLLRTTLQDIVKQNAKTKVITKYSRPWINPKISASLTEVRNHRKQFKKHRSPKNRQLYENKRDEVMVEMEIAQEKWRIEKCEEIAKAESDKEKWKKINKMTNTDIRFDIQPLRNVDPVTKKESYLFKDEDILKEMERYHIVKEGIDNKDLVEEVDGIKDECSQEKGNELMNSKISEAEVRNTFRSCTGAAGPDGVHANLLDKADREYMVKVLWVIWNQAWEEGVFLEGWKEEHRAVIPKNGKEDFHQCDSYRTVSLTAVIGKRFEKISSRRLLIWMEEQDFDREQFAYLEGRYMTQAAILLIEQIKRARVEKKKVAAVFFDFSDAFGTVNRTKLLRKVLSLGVRGKLFQHIADFLCNRKARIKVSSETCGAWIDSVIGSSAGTVLGPILFVIFAKDIPSMISPKFADDTVGLAIGDSVEEVRSKLQQSVDELSKWSEENGMLLNVSKTKVIDFSIGQKERFDIKLGENLIENVSSIKYLGLVLDDNLSFDMQVDSVVGKVNSALNKICILIRGRRGISISVGIDLYKSLVRPHLEYAIPAWSTLSSSQLALLDRLQCKCLKKIMGVFDSTSSNAIEVIANIVPFNFRLVALCNREWVRMMSLPTQHKLKRMVMEGSVYNEREATPLGFMNFVSKDIVKKLEELNLQICQKVSLDSSVITNQRNVKERSIFKDKIGNSKNRTKEQVQAAKVQFSTFMENIEENTLLVFTDGSVLGESCFGEGGCGIVLYTKAEGVLKGVSKKVGRMVDNVACEVEGILYALEIVSQDRKGGEKVHVLTDCKSAIDILVGQREVRKNIKELQRLWNVINKLEELKVELDIIWIPGHADIELNDEADRLAKLGSKLQSGECQEIVSKSVLDRWIQEKTTERWNRAWKNSETGGWTKELISKVGRKIKFPRDRCTGMTYVRLLVNNTATKENMYRFKLVDERECECEEGIESIQHVLMECKLVEEKRKLLEDELGKLWMDESRKAGNLSFGIKLILAPFSYDKVGETLAEKMLFHTFRFLSSLPKVL